MAEPVLSQLLTAFRSGDHVDAQRLADRLGTMTQGQDDLLKRLLADIGLLSQRLARLERNVSGNDTPEDLVEPRPQAKLGDEFPTVAPKWQTVKGTELREWDQVDTESGNPGEPTWGTVRFNGDALIFPRGPEWVTIKPAQAYKRRLVQSALATDPALSPVRVDSLKVGDKCLVECTIKEEPADDGDMWMEAQPTGGGGFYLDSATLVLPVEPSAKVEPAPIQLQVGHRYRRRDNVLANCIAPASEVRGRPTFSMRADDGFEWDCWRDGKYSLNQASALDLVADLGPVKTEEPAFETVKGAALREGDELESGRKARLKAVIHEVDALYQAEQGMRLQHALVALKNQYREEFGDPDAKEKES